MNVTESPRHHSASQLDYDEKVPLNTIINNYKPKKIKSLIDSNFDLFISRGPESESGLHQACFYGKRKIAKMLIIKDPTMIRSKNIYLETPLHNLRDKSDASNIAINILNKDQHVLSDQDIDGRTPVHRMTLNRAYKSATASLMYLTKPHENAKGKLTLLESILPKVLAEITWEYYCPNASMLNKCVNTPDNNGETLLGYASCYELPKKLKRAIKHIKVLIDSAPQPKHKSKPTTLAKGKQQGNQPSTRRPKRPSVKHQRRTIHRNS